MCGNTTQCSELGGILPWNLEKCHTSCQDFHRDRRGFAICKFAFSIVHLQLKNHQLTAHMPSGIPKYRDRRLQFPRFHSIKSKVRCTDRARRGCGVAKAGRQTERSAADNNSRVSGPPVEKAGKNHKCAQLVAGYDSSLQKPTLVGTNKHSLSPLVFCILFR